MKQRFLMILRRLDSSRYLAADGSPDSAAAEKFSFTSTRDDNPEICAMKTRKLADSRQKGEMKMNYKRGKLNMLKTILTSVAVLMLMLIGNIDAVRAQPTTCTPTTTVTEGDLFPGGLVSFSVTSGPGTVTVDHVNAGTGLQSLSVVGTPINATVTIPAFTPGTFSPVTVAFTRTNPNLAVDFTLRAASTFHAMFIRVRCAAANTPPTAQCSNVTVTLDPGATTANADVNAGSFDPDGDPLTLTYNPAGPYPAGQTLVTLTVNDGKGGMDSCMATVTVLYRFRFFDFSNLLSNPMYFMEADAGSDVHIRFSLSGFKGNNPYSSPPVSRRINCINKNPIGAAQTIQTYPGDPFYNATFDFYQTTWRTQAAWAGTCRRLTLFLNDGTTQTLDFRFQ